jgi:hypothetical protein
MARRLLVVFVSLAALTALFAWLHDSWGPAGLLAAVCLLGALGVLIGAPVAALNETLTTYYVDDRWISWYGVGLRRGSVDLTHLRVVSAHTGGHLRIRTRSGWTVFLPGPIAALPRVAEDIANGVHVSRQNGRVRLKGSASEVLGLGAESTGSATPEAPAWRWPKPPVRLPAPPRHPPTTAARNPPEA